MMNTNDIKAFDYRLCDIREDKIMDGKYQWFKQIGYKPFKEQDLAHRSKARFKTLAAGTRFGKSMWAAREVEPYLLLPFDVLGWIAAPTYQLGEKEFRYIWNDMIVDKKLPAIRKNYNVRAGDMAIEFEWGAKLYVRSLKNIFDNLGEEVDFMIISEAAQVNREDWERVLRGRLASRKGKCLIPTTPKGRNWVWDMYKMGQNKKLVESGKYESWLFPSICNPYLDPDEIAEMKAIMDPRFFKEQCGGEFISMTGSVYPDFNVDLNVTSYLPFDMNPDANNWEIYRSIDPGYTNPFCCLWIAVEPIKKQFIKGYTEDGKPIYDSIEYERHWVIQEHYRKQLLLGEHAEIILEMSEPYKDRIVATYMDSEARQEIEELSEFIPDIMGCDKTQFSKIMGIQKVSSKINTIVDGKPLLMVLDYCNNTIREMKDYSHKPEYKDGRNEDEEPKKKDDHCPDCIRYGVTMREILNCELMEYDLYGKEDDNIRTE